MSQQAHQRSLLHRLFSVLPGHTQRPVPKQTNPHPVQPQRPATNDYDAWTAYRKAMSDYWKAVQNHPWRIEPEISLQRQKELAMRRAIIPNTEQSIYPFKGMKLSRADVEWLLATHENGRGPVDWEDEKNKWNREGLDLRGADLRHVNLSKLPLTAMCGGILAGTRTALRRDGAERLYHR